MLSIQSFFVSLQLLSTYAIIMTSVRLHKKTFQELTTEELYELLRVRSEVFVVEQNCIYQDMDGDDQQSIHLWLTVNDKVVALARVCPADTHMKEISIGRVITTERNKGYGKQIMLHAIDAAIEYFGATVIDIEAQEYARGFYETVGFRQSSETFMLDGIPHIKMTWRKMTNK
jgi:ElaA protein